MAEKKIKLNPKKFEKKLLKNKFKLEDISDQECDHDKKEMVYYIQQCECCLEQKWVLKHNKSKYLIWYKMKGCKKDIESSLDCLFCGGHYHDIYIYYYDKKENEEIDKEWHFDERLKDLDPNEPIYSEEELEESRKYQEEEKQRFQKK
jgi:hypothetical protein